MTESGGRNGFMLEVNMGGNQRLTYSSFLKQLKETAFGSRDIYKTIYILIIFKNENLI